MTRAAMTATGVVVMMTALAGCAGESGFCAAVDDDMASSAVVFNPILPGVDTGTASVQNRLDFMDRAGEAPDGLEDEWATYRDHLEDWDADAGEYVAEPGDVKAAREALFDASTECRG